MQVGRAWVINSTLLMEWTGSYPAPPRLLRQSNNIPTVAMHPRFRNGVNRDRGERGQGPSMPAIVVRTFAD